MPLAGAGGGWGGGDGGGVAGGGGGGGWGGGERVWRVSLSGEAYLPCPLGSYSLIVAVDNTVLRAEHRLRALGGQHPPLAALFHAPRLNARLLAETPEKIGAHRALDCAAGVLCQHQAVQRLGGIRVGGREEYRCAE